MQIGEHLERIMPNRRTGVNGNQALPPNPFDRAFEGLKYVAQKTALYIVGGFESQKLRIAG